MEIIKNLLPKALGQNFNLNYRITKRRVSMKQFLKIILLLITVGLINFQLNGQNIIFEYSNKSELDSEQEEVYNTVIKQAHVVEPKVIVFRGKEILDKNSDIGLNISQDVTIEAKSRSIGYENERHWTWFGDIFEGKEKIGYSFVSVNMGNLSGEIWKPFEHYHIDPLGDNKGILYKVNMDKLPAEHSPEYPTGALEYSNSTNSSSEPRLSISSSEQSLGILATAYTYDVLVCYTYNAQQSIGGPAVMNSRIYNSKNQANEVYNNIPQNEWYPNKPLCNIVYTALLYYDDSNGSWETYLNWFKNNWTVNQLRDAYGADIAILIVQPQTSGCGLSADISASSSTAYAVIGSNCYDNRSFVHEIGHLFGGRHQNDEEDEPESYCHGFLEQPGKNWGTVMVAYETEPERIPKFSTPYDEYDEQVIGSSSWRNVAKIHSDYALTVASFKSPDFQVTISGPSSLGYKEWGSYVAYPNGGSYTYVRSGQFHDEMMWSTSFTLKCEVTKYYTTKSGTKSVAYDIGSKISEPENDNIISVNYPNPFNPSTNISYTVSELSDVSITVYNINGEEVINWNLQNVNPGTKQVYWSGLDQNNNKISAGTYLYTVTTTSKSTGKSVTITNKMLLLK